MNRKLISILLCVFIACLFVGCGNDSSDESAQPKEEVATYGVGDSWEVDGLWKLTVDKAEAVEDYQFEEGEKQQVKVTYTVENIGFEDADFPDGLYINFAMAGDVFDSTGEVASVANLGDYWPTPLPVGKHGTFEVYFHLVNVCDALEFTMSQWAGNTEYKAHFDLKF